MNATKAELARLQERIADGRAPELPEGKGDEFYWHPHMKGFALRLYANGSGSWWVQYRNERGQQRRHKIGNAAVLTLSMATGTAKRVFGDIANGLDPQKERHEELAREKCTFGKMAERFLEWHRLDGAHPLSPNTLATYRSAFRNHTGKLMTMQVDEVKRKDVADVLTKAANISNHICHQVRGVISTVYRWGIEQGLIHVSNPVDGAPKPEKSKPREIFLTPEELGVIWRACETMAAKPLCYRGRPRGAEAPIAANSIRDTATLLTASEAARQTGISRDIIAHALDDKSLKVHCLRADLSRHHPASYQLKGRRDERVIQVAELNRFVDTRLSLMRSPDVDFAGILRLLILLGCRYDEIASLHHDEIIEEKAWSGAATKYLFIKGKRTLERRGTKTGDDLKLPLSQMALDVLAEFPQRPNNPRVFGFKGEKRMGTNKLKQRLDAIITAERKGQPSLKLWHIHDLRRSLSTNMNGMGIAPPWIVEQIIGHRGGHKQGVAGTYNRATYDVPIETALQEWAKVIRAVADGIEPNVISLFGHRKEAN